MKFLRKTSITRWIMIHYPRLTPRDGWSVSKPSHERQQWSRTGLCAEHLADESPRDRSPKRAALTSCSQPQDQRQDRTGLERDDEVRQWPRQDRHVDRITASVVVVVGMAVVATSTALSHRQRSSRSASRSPLIGLAITALILRITWHRSTTSVRVVSPGCRQMGSNTSTQRSSGVNAVLCTFC
jgi:hypothetical protein